MMSWYSHWVGAWPWVGMITTMAVFWALVVFGAVLVVRHLAGGQSATSTPTPPTTAERLLAERLARGEIDNAEYTSRLVVLRGQVRP